MYNLSYTKTNGKKFDLSYDNEIIVATVDGLTGIPTNIVKVQGSGQIGETLQNLNVGGRNIVINGFILDQNTEKKEALIKTFAPTTTGRLYFEDHYFIYVVVKDSPDILQEKHSKFSLTLFAPFPFWQKKKAKVLKFAVLSSPNFSFPVKNLDIHTFGNSQDQFLIETDNKGDQASFFDVKIKAGNDGLTNPRIINVTNGKILAFKGKINAGNLVHFYHSEGEYYVDMISGAKSQNAYNLLDEKSNLFNIQQGKNVFAFAADNGAKSSEAVLSYNEAFSGVLADGV